MKLYLKKAEDFTIKDIVNLREFRKPKEPLKSSSGYMLCPTCKGAIGIEGIKFCSNCGQKLRWIKYWREQERKENLTNRIVWNSQLYNFDIN